MCIYDTNIVSSDLLKLCRTKKTELLFLALFLRVFKVDGQGSKSVIDRISANTAA